MLQRYIDYYTNFGRERCRSEADRLLEAFTECGWTAKMDGPERLGEKCQAVMSLQFDMRKRIE
jgi:hypothetical protein